MKLEKLNQKVKLLQRMIFQIKNINKKIIFKLFKQFHQKP
jgi:hypothetical protein